VAELPFSRSSHKVSAILNNDDIFEYYRRSIENVIYITEQAVEKPEELLTP